MESSPLVTCPGTWAFGSVLWATQMPFYDTSWLRQGVVEFLLWRSLSACVSSGTTLTQTEHVPSAEFAKQALVQSWHSEHSFTIIVKCTFKCCCQSTCYVWLCHYNYNCSYNYNNFISSLGELRLSNVSITPKLLITNRLVLHNSCHVYLYSNCCFLKRSE